MGDHLPPLWHWLYFPPTHPSADLDRDGHPRRGGFLPPVPLPRRMWAGSEVSFELPLRLGDTVERLSTVTDVCHKRGRSGDLVFVSLRHEWFRAGELAIAEQQQLVYREPDRGGSGAAPAGAPAQPQWSRTIHPDPVMLFRYSALTFNSHRIHYDRDYAVREEGYAGLVVQGPLTATLLLEQLLREQPEARVESYHFRGLMPLLDGEPFRLEGRCEGAGATLWALDSRGALAMTAAVTLARQATSPPPPVPSGGG